MPSAAFEKAAADAKTFTKKPSDKELLELYALFKQATVGNNETERPGTFDFKGKAKWDAWTEKKNTEDPETKYIEYVESLKVLYA
ncbi:hypothetical protein BGZ98_002955 [Dissophora globulifera]|nr:hypothetical protein BGZ98_002955 [Dissophora globulifera]